MPAISAADSVPLAIQRTRQFLFNPFNWGTYLKLCLVAMVTEGLGWNSQSGSHNQSLSGHAQAMNFPFSMTPERIAMGVFALLLAALVSLLIFYWITRLRFAFFHCLVQDTKEIRPGWRLYKEPATRFFWLNVVVGFCFVAVAGLIALPFISGFLRLFRQSQSGGHFDVALFLSLALPLIPIIFLLFLAGVTADLILRDGMLPHYALENATAGEAWRQVRHRIGAEKRQFFVYALLRLVMPFLAMVGLFILLILPGLALAGAMAAVEFGIHSAFADSAGASAVVGTLLQVFFAVLAFGFAILIGICLGGPLSTGTREYALVFYGGRYQALGNVLYPQLSRSA